LAVNKIIALQIKEKALMVENDNFEGGFIETMKTAADFTSIGQFLILKINCSS